MRFGRQASEALRRGDPSSAATPLLRVVDIVGEMLAGVRHQSADVNKRLADLYWFMFRLASEAKIQSDAEKLAALLRLLEYERQTWQLLCDKLASASQPAAPTKSAFSLKA
jgi:flagellar protein FliS